MRSSSGRTSALDRMTDRTKVFAISELVIAELDSPEAHMGGSRRVYTADNGESQHEPLAIRSRCVVVANRDLILQHALIRLAADDNEVFQTTGVQSRLLAVPLDAFELFFGDAEVAGRANDVGPPGGRDSRDRVRQTFNDLHLLRHDKVGKHVPVPADRADVSGGRAQAGASRPAVPPPPVGGELF